MGWNTKPKQQSFWTKPQHALNIYGQTPTDKLTKLPSVVGAPKPQMQRLGLGGTVYPSNQPGFGKVFEGYMPAQPSAPPKVPMAPVKQFALGPAPSFEKNFGAPSTLEDVQRNIQAVNQKQDQPDDPLSKYQNYYGNKPTPQETLERIDAFNAHLKSLPPPPPVQGPARPPFDMEAFKAGDPRTVQQGMDNNLRAIADKRMKAGWAGITDEDLAARRKAEQGAFFGVPPLPAQEPPSLPAGIGKFGRTGPTFRRGKSGISAEEIGRMEQQLGIPQGMREPQPPPLSLAQAPQQSAPSPIVASRPSPAENPYTGMTPDETVNAMRKELGRSSSIGDVAKLAGNQSFDNKYIPMEAERRRAARLGGNTGPEDAAKAIGPGLDNSAWYLRNPDGTPTVNGTQAPRGDIAKSRFQGAMTFQNPATGRANFIDPSPSGGLDVAGYRRAMEKINQPVDENLKPMYPRSALPIAQGQGEQQPTLPVSYRTGEETGLTPTPRSPIAPPAGRPGLTMMPTSPVGALAAYGASSPQGVDNLKRMAYRENRQQELQARKDRRFQLAQGEAQARRERLANRNAPPNPLAAMAMQNPELALGLAELNQRGQLGALQNQLAQAQLAQQGELGRGELELGRERNKMYGTTQETDRAQRGELAAMEQIGREKALEWEKQRAQMEMQAQGLGAALEAGVITPEEFQQGVTSLAGQGGLGVYQPPVGNTSPGSRLTPNDRKEMAAMDHPTMRKFLIAKGITDPQERTAVMQEFFPDEKGLTDSQVGYNLGELGAELYPPYGIYTQIRKQIDPSFRTAWGRFNEDRKKRSAKGE